MQDDELDGPLPQSLSVLSESLYADCKVYTVYKQRCRYLLDGREGDFYTMRCPNWVQVLALTREGQLILVKQYRIGIQAFQLETPGGALDPGESPEAGAARELLEETGYVGAKPLCIGSSYPNPALQENTVYYVLIRDCYYQASPYHDPMEDLTIHLYPLTEAFASRKKGLFKHALVLNAFYFLEQYLSQDSLCTTPELRS